MTSRLTYSLPPMYVLNSDSLYGSWMGAQPHSRRGGHNRTQQNEQPTFVSDVVPLPPPLSSPLLPHLTPAIVIFLTPRNVVVAVDGWMDGKRQVAVSGTLTGQALKENNSKTSKRGRGRRALRPSQTVI